MLLLLNVVLVSVAAVLWWQLRHGVIWLGFGLHVARRATEPVAYWLGIVGACFILLLMACVVGSLDLALLQRLG